MNGGGSAGMAPAPAGSGATAEIVTGVLDRLGDQGVVRCAAGDDRDDAGADAGVHGEHGVQAAERLGDDALAVGAAHTVDLVRGGVPVPDRDGRAGLGVLVPVAGV